MKATQLTESQFRSIVISEHRSLLIEAKQDAVDKMFKDILGSFKTMFPKVSKYVEDKAEEKEDELQEAAGLAALGLTLASPALVKAFSKIGKFFGKKLESALGRDLGVEEKAQVVYDAANKVHHLFEKPFIMFAKNVLRIKDPRKAELAGKVLFSILLGFLVYHGGVAVVKGLEHGDLAHAAVEGTTTAIKSGEITAYLGEVLSELGAFGATVAGAAEMYR